MTTKKPDGQRDWLDLDSPPDISWPPADYAAPRLPNDIPDPETPEPAAPILDLRVHRIDWVSGKPRELLIAHAQWDAAVARAADGDTEQLIALLRSDLPLHRDSRDLLVELLVTRQIARKPGRQTTPGRVSPAQGELQWQAALYRDHRSRGLGHDEALCRALIDGRAERFALRGEKPPSDEEIAEAVTDAEIERLHAHVRGKRSASRRVWKRRRG